MTAPVSDVYADLSVLGAGHYIFSQGLAVHDTLDALRKIDPPTLQLQAPAKEKKVKAGDKDKKSKKDKKKGLLLHDSRLDLFQQKGSYRVGWGGGPFLVAFCRSPSERAPHKRGPQFTRFATDC